VTALRVREANGRVRFSVRVQPRAAHNEVTGVHGDALKIRLSAPPVDGAANDALVDFLADIFAVSRRAVTILAGVSSRTKVVEIRGITERAVHELAARSGR
jgi:uncharacterized protein (TIGR00251 family)